MKNMELRKFYPLFLPILSLIFSATLVLATGQTPAGGGQAPAGGGQAPSQTISIDPLIGTDFQTVAQRIISNLVVIAIPITSIMVLVGAFQILTSAGDPEKAKKGRNTILYAVIGFAFVLLAEGVSFIIQDVLSGSTPSGPTLDPTVPL